MKHSLSMAPGGGGGGGAGGVVRPPEPGGSEPGGAGGRSEGGGPGEVGGKRDTVLSPPTGTQPPKRIRLTRKTAGLVSED